MTALTTLSDDERLFFDTILGFARERVGPRVAAMDEVGALDPAVVPALFELGVMGVEIPSAHSGSESSFFNAILAVEAIAAQAQPRFLRDGSLAYLLERRDGNRTVTQVMKADLATGQTTPLTGPELLVVGYAVAPAGDLLALVMPAAGQERRRNPAYKVYIRPIGSGSPAAIPTGERSDATSEPGRTGARKGRSFFSGGNVVGPSNSTTSPLIHSRSCSSTLAKRTS